MKKKLGEYKIKNRYLIYIILCSFCLGSFLGIVVHPASALIPNHWYICDFSGYTNGQQANEVPWFQTQILANPQFSCDGAGRFKINKAWDGSGANKPNGNFLFSYTADYNLSLLNYTMKMNIGTGTGIFYMYFNDTTTGDTFVKLQCTGNPHWLILFWNYTSSAWQTLNAHNGSDIGNWHYLNVTFYPITHAVKLRVDTIGKNEVIAPDYYTNSLLTSASKFDKIYMVDTQYNHIVLIDDVGVKFDDNGYVDPGYNCGYLFDGYSFKGSLNTNTPISYSRFAEITYDVMSDIALKGVELLVHRGTTDLTSDLYLKVNGEAIGHDVCIQHISDYWDKVIWSFDKTISNDKIVFEFSCPAVDLNLNYVYSDDLDDDGDILSSYHNSYSLWNGVFDGNLFLRDFSYKFYYDDMIFQNETSPYTDLVTSTKTGFETFDTIPVYYFIADYSYTNSIQLWKSGVQQTAQGFPFTVTSGDFNGELSFTPFHSGSYQFRLMRNSIIRSSFNFTVTDPADTDFVLAVYPNPCEFNTEVNIGYRFYPDDGSDGFIGVSEFPGTSNFSSFSEYWMLSANTSGNKTFFAQTNMYVSLWKKTGSSYVRMKIKYLKMGSMFDNTINVGYKSIALSDAVPSVSQRIYGTQVVQGFNTFVRMNNKLLQYVTDTPFYNVYAPVSKGGNYNVELCMETANGSKVLCAVNFTVSSPSAGGGAGAEAFPPEMKLLFGICCILVAVSCPLMISVKYHVAVPTFVYVVFMAFGIGIGTVLGFLELWLVFLFVVALVAGAVFTIFGHGGSGGGGGDSGTIRKGGILSRRGGKDYAGASRKADYGVSPKGSPGYLKGPGRRGY